MQSRRVRYRSREETVLLSTKQENCSPINPLVVSPVVDPLEDDSCFVKGLENDVYCGSFLPHLFLPPLLLAI